MRRQRKSPTVENELAVRRVDFVGGIERNDGFDDIPKAFVSVHTRCCVAFETGEKFRLVK